jgi:hypothetical protein
VISEENASYRLGYAILLVGLLVLIIVRALRAAGSLVENLDLVALMLASSLVILIYQRSKQLVSHRWIFIFLCTMCVILLAALLGLVFLLTRP